MSDETMPVAAPAAGGAPAAPAAPVTAQSQPAAEAQPSGMKAAGEAARAKFASAEGTSPATPAAAPAAGQPAATPATEAAVEAALKVMINGQELPAEDVKGLQDSLYKAQVLDAFFNGDQKVIEKLKEIAPEAFGLKKEEPAAAAVVPNPAHDPIIDENNKLLKQMQEKITAMEFEKKRETTFKQLDQLGSQHRMKEFFVGEHGEKIISNVERLAYADAERLGGLDKAYAHHAAPLLNMVKGTISNYVQTKTQHAKVNTETGGGAPVQAPTSAPKTIKEAGKIAREKLQGPIQF